MRNILGGTGTLSSAYAQHRWLPSDRFDVTVGLRTSTYDQTDDLYWEPRASAQFRITDNVRLKGAWGQYHQFVKRVENEDVLEGPHGPDRRSVIGGFKVVSRCD